MCILCVCVLFRRVIELLCVRPSCRNIVRVKLPTTPFQSFPSIYGRDFLQPAGLCNIISHCNAVWPVSVTRSQVFAIAPVGLAWKENIYTSLPLVPCEETVSPTTCDQNIHEKSKAKKERICFLCRHLQQDEHNRIALLAKLKCY